MVSPRPWGPLVLAALMSFALVGCSGATDDAGPVRSSAVRSSQVAARSPGATPSTPSAPTTPGASTPAAPPIAALAKAKITKTSTIVKGLDAPWGLAFLPDKSALVTERDTEKVLRVVGHKATTLKGAGARQIRTMTRHAGEGGLLGIAVSPRFAKDHRVFVYLTAATDNRVLRLTLKGTTLAKGVVILKGIPKGSNHNGGRLAFGPDGFLYVTTGDTYNRTYAQSRKTLGGKILRITSSGKPAKGNPRASSPIWTWGHRNVQGLGWAPDGRMFASEFGQNTWDELNLIRKGKNYGWPHVEGKGTGGGKYVSPLKVWHTDNASPSGIAVTTRAIYLAGLRGERLWRVPLTSKGVGKAQALLTNRGRLRAVVEARDGSLWVLTNNTDGRGTPRRGDDRLLRIVVAPS